MFDWVTHCFNELNLTTCKQCYPRTIHLVTQGLRPTQQKNTTLIVWKPVYFSCAHHFATSFFVLSVSFRVFHLIFTVFHYHGPLTSYARLWVAQPPGMQGTFSLPRRVTDPHIDYGVDHKLGSNFVIFVPAVVLNTLSPRQDVRHFRDAFRGRYLAVCFEFGCGDNVPGLPGTCATRSFTYLVRSPCRFYFPPRLPDRERRRLNSSTAVHVPHMVNIGRIVWYIYCRPSEARFT